MVIPEPSSKVKIIEQTNITFFFGILYFFSLISFFDIISFVGIFQVRLFSLSCTSFSIFCLLFFYLAGGALGCLCPPRCSADYISSARTATDKFTSSAAPDFLLLSLPRLLKFLNSRI